MFDAGYDVELIYRQALSQSMRVVIPYNIRHEREYIGFDEHFRPTCVREHCYRYDSFDAKYNTLKFTRPKECATCPLREDTLCQKVFKIKCDTDLRKFTYPARGTVLWKQYYKERKGSRTSKRLLKRIFSTKQCPSSYRKKTKVHLQSSETDLSLAIIS